MGLVVCDMPISLDGYVTGRENPFGDGAGSLHDWLFKNPADSDRAHLDTAPTHCSASAIQQAQEAAGDRWVGLHGATVMQQALPLDLGDEIYVHVVPLLLGGGTPLFASLDSAIRLERIATPGSPAVDHLRYRVVR